MLTVIVTLLVVSNCYTFGSSVANLPGNGLHSHSEIHEAKSLIDALSSKLYLNLQKYQNKYENFRTQSNEYLAQSGSTQDQIKTLNKLKGILNELTNKTNSVCEKFYTNFDFIAARKILIDSNVLLPKDYTVELQVNHLDLINNDLALASGNDVRVYFLKEEDCQPREIDRILENTGTTTARVLFKLQEDFNKTVLEGSVYFLVYGNKAASKAKQNPENVYIFYDDFSDSNLQKKWKGNWGVVQVQNGALGLKTGSTPTGNSAEIAVLVKHGYEWEDIEVELDFNEQNSGKDVAPGPFLRVQDAVIASTTAWWFEYVSTSDHCTMRPFKNNADGGWLYKITLTERLSPGSWNHAKYRVVGESFSHWLNNRLVHDNVNVSSKWMIAKGTVGFGCHKGNIGCHTLYDNIKIKKYISASPSVSLGPECKVDLKKFHGLGTSKQNPAASCKQIHDISLLEGKLDNGVYWIKTSTGHSIQTYCDLANGGWTLVGKVSGFDEKLYAFWLIKNRNLDTLKNPALPSKVGCIDARYIATYHASTIMFASGDNQNGIGSKWVQWPLPQGRGSDSLWKHSIGRDKVSKAKMYHVTVKAWNGNEQVCYQNKYGIMPFAYHGGSYPSATVNTAGNTRINDYCMSVGVQKKGTTADGWTQNGNGYDSPQSKSDWPNSAYNHQSPYITVWLK